MPINSYNWNLIKSINNKNSDTYFIKKYPDSFLNTDLKKYLDENNIKNIEICGAQTESCIDTTIKVGFHLGFHITMNKNSYSTFNNKNMNANKINNWYWNIWNKRFININ